MPTHELFKRTKGPMANDEDWWRLIVDSETGEMRVEHEWSHTRINGLQTDSGSKLFTLDEFHASDEPPRAKVALDEFLAKMAASQS